MKKLPHKPNGRPRVWSVACIALLTLFILPAVLPAMMNGQQFPHVLMFILLTDLMLIALLAVMAEQISAESPRARRQFRIAKLLQITAVIAVYLSIARALHRASGETFSERNWVAFAIVSAIGVVLMFPVVLIISEEAIWNAVSLLKSMRPKQAVRKASPVGEKTLEHPKTQN